MSIYGEDRWDFCRYWASKMFYAGDPLLGTLGKRRDPGWRTT